MMVGMRFLKSIRTYWPDYVFLCSIVAFSLLYFATYMSASKALWYHDMYKEVRVAINGITKLL